MGTPCGPGVPWRLIRAVRTLGESGAFFDRRSIGARVSWKSGEGWVQEVGAIRNDDNTRFSALIESTEAPIWSVDPNSQLIAFNCAFAQLVERNSFAKPEIWMNTEDLLPASVDAA